MSIGPDGAGFRACSAAVEAIGGVSARCAILTLSRSSRLRLRLRLQRAVAGRILGSLGILRILLASSWLSSVLRLDRMDPNGLPIALDLFVLPPATSFSFPRSAARSSTRSAHLLRCHHPSSPFASLPSYTLPDRALCASLPRFRIVPARIVTSPRASLVRAHHTLLHTRSALVADHPPVW